MSNALYVKREATEKLEFLGTFQQINAVVAELVLILQNLRGQRESFLAG